MRCDKRVRIFCFWHWTHPQPDARSLVATHNSITPHTTAFSRQETANSRFTPTLTTVCFPDSHVRALSVYRYMYVYKINSWLIKCILFPLRLYTTKPWQLWCLNRTKILLCTDNKTAWHPLWVIRVFATAVLTFLTAAICTSEIDFWVQCAKCRVYHRKIPCLMDGELFFFYLLKGPMPHWIYYRVAIFFSDYKGLFTEKKGDTNEGCSCNVNFRGKY